MKIFGTSFPDTEFCNGRSQSAPQSSWLLFCRSGNILALNVKGHLGIQGAMVGERAPASQIRGELYPGDCFASLNRNLKNSPISICPSPASRSFSTFLQVSILLTLFNDTLKISLALEAFFTSLFCCLSQVLALKPYLPEITALWRSNSSIPKYCIPFETYQKEYKMPCIKQYFGIERGILGLVFHHNMIICLKTSAAYVVSCLKYPALHFFFFFKFMK